jgi:hypothetical protein
MCTHLLLLKFTNHYFDHHLNSEYDFGVKPLAVALFYCPQSSSITIQNYLNTLQIFKFNYENLSIFIIELIL